MTIISRKKRELQQRENLLLEKARRILLKNGYSGLTMERIAESAEYSKGTVYNHFRCKEEVVAELASRILHGKAVFVERAAAFKGRSRERLTAVAEAAVLFARLYPEDIRIMQVLQTQALMRNIPQKLQEKIRAQDNRASNAINSVVRAAIEQGDLDPQRFTEQPAEELAFGICCVIDGGHVMLARYDNPRDFGPRNPFKAISHTIDTLADGAGWKPSSSETDFDKIRENVDSTIFPQETRRLKE